MRVDEAPRRQYEWYYSPTPCPGDALLYLQILLVIISTAGLELRSQPNRVMAGFLRTNAGGSGGGEAQQAADADAAQRHYQPGLAALERNDLAAAEEEMQAAARLAPKSRELQSKDNCRSLAALGMTNGSRRPTAWGKKQNQ